MEAKSASEDDSSETSQSSFQKPLKPKRRSLVERELETNMTARVTSPLSFIEPGLNTSRYGRARKVQVDKEFCDTNKAVSDYLKSPESELSPSPNIIKSSPKPTTSASNASPKAENFIEKIHCENLSLSRFGSITKPSPVKSDKTYVRKDLIQRKDNDPSLLLKNMFSPSKSPYKPSKSSHLNIFLERSSADKSAIELNETVTMDGLFNTPDVKECSSKNRRKRVRKSDSAVTETKKADSSSLTKSSSTKKSKRHTICAANAVVVKTLDFNTKNKKEQSLKQQQEHKTEHPKSKQLKTEQPKSKQHRTEQPKSKQLKTEQPPKKQSGSSSKKKKPKIATLIEIPEPQGLLIEKTSVVKTLDFDIKKKPSTLKTAKEEIIKIEPDIKPIEKQAQIQENIIIQHVFATNGLFENESLCNYNVGDLAWSRIGTYPFWPCIVTREPFTELFVKKKLFGRVERDVIHVTFFADNGRRGWIVDNMMRHYHGIAEFLSARDGFTAEDKKKDPKLYAAYFISDKKRETWNQAVNEAENLLKEPKHLRTDVLYEMLSKNKNVKILKKPKDYYEILKTIKLETPVKLASLAPDLNKPRTLKLDRTDSDVSLSESLYDSLFSDDDSKAVDPDKSRNKLFDVSDVVTACLDNMAVKTGMAKIQMQSHMDRWLQKAKSLTPEKIQKVLTPNKDRKDRSARKNKKTPVKTVTDKPYPLIKFAKESPDDRILNSYQTEHDYIKYDIENENPGDIKLNAEVNGATVDEVHYIESGKGIGTILSFESLSDKASDSQETLNDTEIIDISTVSEGIVKTDSKVHLNENCDTTTVVITNSNEEAMEINTSNLEIQENVLNSSNFPLTDTENTSYAEVSATLSNENDQDLSNTVLNKVYNSIASGAVELMDVEQETPEADKHAEDTNLLNKEDNNKVLISNSMDNVSEDISVKNRIDSVSSIGNNKISEQILLCGDQTGIKLKPTQINGDINTSCFTQENTQNVVKNGVFEADLEFETKVTNPDQNMKTDSIDEMKVPSENQTALNQITNADQGIRVSNSKIIHNHTNIDTTLKNEENSKEPTIIEDLQNKLEAKETIKITKAYTFPTKRRSLRIKCEQQITSQAVCQVKENCNIVPDIIKYSEVEIQEKTENSDLDQITLTNTQLNTTSNISIKNHGAIDIQLKNIDLSNEIAVKNVTKDTETINVAEKIKSASRKSLRTKIEHPNTKQAESQVKQNCNIVPETIKYSKSMLDLQGQSETTICEKITSTNGESNDTNLNVVQNHDGVNDLLKNHDLSSEVVVENDSLNILGANSKEIVNKTEIKPSATRRSLRTKTEPSIIAQAKHPVNENSNIDLETIKDCKIVLNVLDNTNYDQIMTNHQKINVSDSNHIKNHESIDNIQSNDEHSFEPVVKNDLQNIIGANSKETVNKKEVIPLATRKSLRVKPEPHFRREEQQVNETSDIVLDTKTYSIQVNSVSPENAECDQITIDQEMKVSNHEVIDKKLKNIDSIVKAVVKHDLQNIPEANNEESTKNTEVKPLSTRKSLKAKQEPHFEKANNQVENGNIKPETLKSSNIILGFLDKSVNNVDSNIEGQGTAQGDKVEENSNIKPENSDNNTIGLELPDNVTDNKNHYNIENEVKETQRDNKTKSGRLSSLDKLNQIPQVAIVKLNFCHMEINKKKMKEVVDDIKINNYIETLCNDAIETRKEKRSNIENTKTAPKELIQKTKPTKLENGHDHSTNNNYAKLNGTSEIATNGTLDLKDCKTIPGKEVSDDLIKTEEHSFKRSKRIRHRKRFEKPIDWQKEIDEAKKMLLEDTDDHEDSKNCSLQDIKANTVTNNIPYEQGTKATHLEKEINLITSVSEQKPNAKYQKVDEIVSKDAVHNKAHVKTLSFQKVFSNLCDQKLKLVTPPKESKPNRNKVCSKTPLVNDNNERNVFDSKNAQLSSENAYLDLCNVIEVDSNGKKHIDLTSIKINKLESNSDIKIHEIHGTESNIIRMTEDLDVTPEKILNADVIIENGHTDESDTELDVKIEAISVISSIDTPLPRKRGRPRKSNNLVIDDVVIEEINLTDDKVEDIQPRKRGRPKKYNDEPDNALTNGYNGYTDSLPEFAHLMDLDVSLDGTDYNQAVKVDNIAFLTDAEVLAKVTEANLNNRAFDVDDCQVIPVSIEENAFISKQRTAPKKTNMNANKVVQECQPIVNTNAPNREIVETPPAITEQGNNTNLENDKANNSELETSDKIVDMKNNHRNIDSISLSSISIKSELESESNCYPQSETEDKQSLNEEAIEADEKAPKNEDNTAKQVSEETEEKDQEIQEGTSKRRQRVKAENKQTNAVYKALDDPEFAKYLEMRQDALIDENPHVSQDDVVSYLYKTWIYEQSLKPDAVKSDDLIELNLVKGLGNNTTSQPKRIKKRVKSQVDKEEKYDIDQVIIPRDRSKRRTNAMYATADDTDIEDELKVFEIFNKNKPKAKKASQTPSTSKNETENVVPTEIKTDSELDDVPLANLIADKDKQTITVDLIEKEEEVKIPFDQVEYYFSQLIQPKPNVFKGLVRERVCDICFKTSNLVKCKGPCNGMFHVECVKDETTQVAIQNPWTRGRKKKKPRGARPKNRSHDDSQSDDKDINLDDILDSTLSIEIDAENFELQLAEKMKELIEKEKVQDLASSDEELQWDDADPGKCEIVNITLKTRRNLSHNSDIDFKCNDCLKLTTPKCYVCKSEKSPKNSIELRQRCQIAQCHKYYHLECLDLWPQTQFNQGESARKTADLFDILSCPRHVCHSCVCDDPRGCNTRFSGEKLARCVKCPATYHSFTKCLPAGSQILTASHIICPRHTVNRPGKVPCHVNTGWCFICAQGGSLICCDYCPTSFHADCLNIATPEGNYMCEDCETGRLPLYGEMVWVKLGHYRWWPGLVLHPCEIPDNIRCMKHSPGEFVVRFFGQYDHYWVNRGRVFPFQEGDSGRISSQKSKIDEAFTLAIEHAQRAFQILKTVPPNEEEEAEIAQSFLPPQYVKLRVNKPCGSVQIVRGDDELHGLSQCDCDPRAERPCDPNTQCLNRMLLTECGPSCRAEDRCQNRAFEKRQYPKMAPYRTPHRGWGLRTQEEVKAGQFVIEYVGELIDETEFKRRMQLKHEIRDENYYFLTLDKERMIDAGPKGNLARFMNHSCEPNCETQKWTVLGDVRVGLFALHDIPAFTELTFNYNLECAGIDKKRCMCGALRCSGYIGAKPKTLEEINPKKNIQTKKRIYKKRKKEDSPPTTKIKIPKPRTTTRSKPKELTEIEKDLLIIKSATIGLLSSDSECSLKLNLEEKLNLEDKLNLEAKANKRKRSSSFVSSSDDFLNSSDVPSGKVMKLELLLKSEYSSSEGN